MKGADSLLNAGSSAAMGGASAAVSRVSDSCLRVVFSELAEL